MPDVLGPEWFPRTPEESAEFYRRHVAGWSHTNWPLLASSARSNLCFATREASHYLTYLETAFAESRTAGEIYLDLCANYPYKLSGPVLGSLLCSTMALESLVLFVGEVAVDPDSLIEKVSDRLVKFIRANGRTPDQAELDEIEGDSAQRLEQMEERLHRIGGGKFTERLAATLRASGCPGMPAETVERLDALLEFRNDIVHDSPIKYLAGFHTQRRRRGRRKRYEAHGRYSGLFPSMVGRPVSITPTHAVVAARLHDQVLTHLLDSASPEVTAALKDQMLGGLGLPITREEGSFVPFSTIEAVASAFDSQVVAWLDSLEPSDLEGGVRDSLRRLTLRADNSAL